MKITSIRSGGMVVKRKLPKKRKPVMGLRDVDWKPTVKRPQQPWELEMQRQMALGIWCGFEGI
jgi:hypothetical protein